MDDNDQIAIRVFGICQTMLESRWRKEWRDGLRTWVPTVGLTDSEFHAFCKIVGRDVPNCIQLEHRK